MLLRTVHQPIAPFMRRFLAGYAVTFNRRHRRHGQLFQNRYKSIPCQEDPYLLELVRFIHLNPLRTNISIASIVLFLGTKKMIGRMLIICSGFSIEKGKLPKAYLEAVKMIPKVVLIFVHYFY